MFSLASQCWSDRTRKSPPAASVVLLTFSSSSFSTVLFIFFFFFLIFPALVRKSSVSSLSISLRLHLPNLPTPAPLACHYSPSLSPSSLVLSVQALASSPRMEQEQTDFPLPCRLPLIPTTHTIPSDASASPNPAAFPLNAARPRQAALNSHGPGFHMNKTA